MINDELGIDAESFVQLSFVSLAQPRHIPHGEASECFESPRDSRSDAPEIRERSVTPEELPICIFIQLRDTHAVFVSRDVLRHDIHRDLCEIKVRSDACRGCDSCFRQDFPDHGDRQLMGSHVIRVQIGSYVQKAFVDTVYDDVVGADVFHVNGNDPGADLLIKLHSGRSDIVCELQGRIRCKSGSIERGPAEMIFTVVGGSLYQAEPDCLLQALGIDLFDSLHDLEQPGTS